MTGLSVSSIAWTDIPHWSTSARKVRFGTGAGGGISVRRLRSFCVWRQQFFTHKLSRGGGDSCTTYMPEAHIPSMMLAMVLSKPFAALEPKRIPIPQAKTGEILLKVQTCAVCRTDLHVVDGELPEPKLPLIPGHEIVGNVLWCGSGRFSVGQRVGIP